MTKTKPVAARIALLNALLPLTATLGAYLIALLQGYGVVCVPLWEGCTSISRAARYGDALFWFRGLMMPLSVLLVIFWIFQVRWLAHHCGKQSQQTVILWLGIVSALALIVYVNFLGSGGDIYRFMRRFGVTFYFGLAMLAQLLSIHLLFRHRSTLPATTQVLLSWQLLCVGAQWSLGLVSLAITLIEPSFKSQAGNIIEWNFALAMTAFYALSALIWHRENY
jgi:uncharacterized membrane protein